MNLMRIGGAAAAGMAAMFCSPLASAQSRSPAPGLRGPGAVGTDGMTEQRVVPNTPLILSGAGMLVSSYAASVAVAAHSDLSADKNLYVPLVGPWLDLGDRGDCALSGAPCRHENTNKALLVVDGLAQGLGGLQILGGFLFPKTRTVTRPVAPGLHVSPTAAARGLGVTAYGEF